MTVDSVEGVFGRRRACYRRVVDGHLNLGALRKAIAPLEGGLRVTEDTAWLAAQSDAVRATLIAGVVQNFEFVHELSMKMLRRQFDVGADSPADVDRATSATC